MASFFKLLTRAPHQRSRQDDAARLQQLEETTLPAIHKAVVKYEQAMLEIARIQETRMLFTTLPCFKALSLTVVGGHVNSPLDALEDLRWISMVMRVAERELGRDH
jgi:hypothetical protein